MDRLVKSDFFGLSSTLLLVFLILILKGTTGEGQPALFSNLVRKYIEETSASVLGQTQSSLQLADLNSLSTLNIGESGQGGTEAQLNPDTVNDNSFLAHNPPSSDYIETTGSKRTSISEYVVQEGDALSFIASDYGVNVSSIIWANNLRDADSISPGQTLKIPPVSGIIHTVKSGDTLSIVAKKYGAEETKIIEFNSLPQDGTIKSGDQIIIPDGKIKTSSVAVAPNSNSATRFSYLPNLTDYFMSPTGGFNWGKIHGRNGVDIANSCGTTIFAAAEGSINVADISGWNGGFGKYIKIIHPNGTETLYAHTSKVLVNEGEYVQKGQGIALMGSTGRSTGCHLHFEVHGAKNPLAKY